MLITAAISTLRNRIRSSRLISFRVPSNAKYRLTSRVFHFSSIMLRYTGFKTNMTRMTLAMNPCLAYPTSLSLSFRCQIKTPAALVYLPSKNSYIAALWSPRTILMTLISFLNLTAASPSPRMLQLKWQWAQHLPLSSTKLIIQSSLPRCRFPKSSWERR